MTRRLGSTAPAAMPPVSAPAVSATRIAAPSAATDLRRRGLLAGMGALVAVGALGLRPAAALTPPEAEEFVSRLVAEMTELVQSGLPTSAQAERFRDIFVRYSALPQITRFVMGITWREMSDAQKDAFREAFLDYVGRVYAALLSDYEGQTIEVQRSQDFGDRGVLVTSIGRGPQVDGSAVEWLVSDRGGDGPKLVDITAEGISLLQTQRQEFGAMLERRNGDVDAFIADLRQAG